MSVGTRAVAWIMVAVLVLALVASTVLDAFV
jgi:hypothetical protein